MSRGEEERELVGELKGEGGREGWRECGYTVESSRFGYMKGAPHLSL